MKIYIILLVFVCLACDSSGPSDGSFRVVSVNFTGDPIPCEFTLGWENAGSEYQLYRSLESGIELHPLETHLVCSTDDTVWSDSDSLEWGTVYYYAVRADKGIWSNEVHIQTPSSPYPVPCELSMEKTGFTDCFLEWTPGDDGFSTYALLRSDNPDMERLYSYADTLFCSSCSDSVSYTDHFASPDRVTYYAVAVSDTLGLSSFSNVTAFTPGGDIPWRFSRSTVVHGLQGRNYLVTMDSKRFTGSRSYSSYSFGKVFSAENGMTLCQAYMDPRFILVLENERILVSHFTENGYMLSLFSPDFETEMVTRCFPPASCAVELDGGILIGGVSSSILVDPQTLETLQTFGFGFTGAVLSPGQETVFLLGSSGVILLDTGSMWVAGGIPGFFTSVQTGTDGNVYCINSQRVQVFDSASLSMIHQYDFPEMASVPAVALLPPECRFAYVPVWENNTLVFRVWDIFSGETPGTVRCFSSDFTLIWDVLPAPSGDYLWGLGSESDGTQLMFKISPE